jgi:hypothetical protein
MNRVMRILLVLCLLAAVLFLLPGCATEKDGGAETEASTAAEAEGQLPTWNTGDKWVWSYAMEGTTYTLTEEVTGEETVAGRSCYVIDMSFDPVISSTYNDVKYTVTSMKYWADKNTGLLGVKMEQTTTGGGQTFTSSTIYSYDPWIVLFPLEIGKEVEAAKTTTQYQNGSQSGDPIVGSEKYEVIGKEDITVTAGTFSCWKMNYYLDGSSVTQTMWYSDRVKSMIKSTDEAGNTMMELLSYSIH